MHEYSTVTTDKKFVAFENKVLRRIPRIKWWQRVSNSRIREITGVQPVDEFVRFLVGSGLVMFIEGKG